MPPPSPLPLPFPNCKVAARGPLWGSYFAIWGGEGKGGGCVGRGRRRPPKKTIPHPPAKQKQVLTRPRHQAQRGTVVEYMVAFGVARARFPADADLCPSSLCHRFAGSRLRLAQEVLQTPAPSACACRYRSHFGSRYKLGWCGHAGLFCPCCVTQHVLQCYAARAPMSPVGCACSSGRVGPPPTAKNTLCLPRPPCQTQKGAICVIPGIRGLFYGL